MEEFASEDLAQGNASIDGVIARAEASADLEAIRTEVNGSRFVAEVSYPMAREKRKQVYDERDAEQLLKFPFEKFRFLPHTDGLHNPNAGTIEAEVRIRGSFKRVNGAKAEAVPIGGSGIYRERRIQQYSLKVTKQNFKLELGPASAEFVAIVGLGGVPWRTNTVRLTVPKSKLPKDSESVERKFRSLTLAFFFELDTQYGVFADFSGTRMPSRLTATDPPVAERARFPKHGYPAQASSLYQYARGAEGFPLLAYLAYYQVLEFFFPIFTQAEAVRRVRNVIVDPRFAATRDHSILRVVSAVRETSGKFINESEQLHHTINACTSVEEIREYIEYSKNRAYFSSKKQPLPGMTQLTPGSPDLLKQLADRVYDIRCRIVHTKSDGGESRAALLLPDSLEVRDMAPDVELVRLLARAAISAGAEALDLN